MILPRSLQVRLALGLSVGLALFWAVAAGAAYTVLRQEMDRVFDSALQETAQRLLPLAVMEIIDREPEDVLRIAPVRSHHELLTYIVRNQAGSVVLASHDADPAIFPQSAHDGLSSTKTHRIYAESALQGSLTIFVAEPWDVRSKASHEAAEALIMPLLVLVPLSFGGVWLLVRGGMRPIRRLCSEIETRGGGDLTPLGSDRLPSEITPIATAVNHLMARLRRTLEAERSFTANSAHELRTPIAAALAQTQRLLAETKEGQTGARARQIEATLKTLARLAEKLMQLARAEGGRLFAKTPYDIVPVIGLVCEDIGRTQSRPDRLDLDLPSAKVNSRVDPDALSILVRNLLENALKYGAADEPVVVTLTQDGVLRVVNGGPVIPAERLAQLTRPFERASTEAEGSGLGLAIIDAIARGAGSNLELKSPATGRADGFEAVVRLAGV
ncbi:Sensor protein QseC [Hartmannibacter diazotrophicus]|uniref:histidine kinase n=1 Tax=Hartmannibacter diazotrophicus TaxID=1482074 RepID=A0A2C9DCC2_9HYPH|nr:ATP-binding protein [Hartmannibacter diazotrophicus]SON57255.1 Sensor protein QseC [Hartmannibacter diazotrophicus]